MGTFKSLKIWKSAFVSDNNEDMERLSVALDTVRKNAGALGRKIAADFSNLTIHDVTHMDALWDVADLFE